MLILILELGLMLAFSGWRRVLAGGGAPNVEDARRAATISLIQAALVVLMVLAATGMARGYGVPGR